MCCRCCRYRSLRTQWPPFRETHDLGYRGCLPEPPPIYILSGQIISVLGQITSDLTSQRACTAGFTCVVFADVAADTVLVKRDHDLYSHAKEKRGDDGDRLVRVESGLDVVSLGGGGGSVVAERVTSHQL
jgi:hypothetical protein